MSRQAACLQRNPISPKIMKRKFPKVNVNLFIAIAAIVISMCALVVSIYEVRIMRAEQKVAVYPYLSIGTFYNGNGFGMFVKNSGTGLARINSYQVYTKGKHFKSWPEVVDHYAPEGHSIDYGIMSSNLLHEEIITPNERVNIFEVRWTDETRLMSKKVDDLEIKICYSSLLDEYWEVKNDKSRRQLDGPCVPLQDQEFLY